MLNIDLEGKRAFVAGVSDDGGFGFAIAKALAQAGASVCVGSWPPALGISHQEEEGQVGPGHGSGQDDGERAKPTTRRPSAGLRFLRHRDTSCTQRRPRRRSGPGPKGP